MNKEGIMIIATIASIVLIVVSMIRLNKLQDTGQITPSKKNLLIYISILFPVVGFLWTYSYRTDVKNKIFK